MKKYTNLFQHFNRLGAAEQMVFQNIHKITKSAYPTSNSLLFFDQTKYRGLYKSWGDAGIFEHAKNEITPLIYGLINYQIESIDSALRSGYSVQSSLVIHPIEKFGSDNLKSKYLPGLYSGDKIGCFGLTEPGAGSDPATMATRAVKNGDHYVVNGSKVWITNSPIADVFVIWCKDETGQIIGLVTGREEGIQTPEIKEKMSLLASPTGYIYMDNVKIPVENKLDVRGLRGPFECLNKARYGISWGTVGATENILNTAIEYTDERKQFGRALNANQLVQSDIVKCVELYTNSVNHSFASLHVIESFDDLKKNLALISFLKRANCENALNVARICRDLLGGNGVSNSYNIMRHLVNLEAVNTYEGTRNVHNLILGRELLGKNAF